MMPLFIALVLAFGPGAAGAGQTMDPFYTGRLEAGVSLLEASLYAEALKEFEVAAFGLSSQRDLLVKAIALKGLCQSKLGDKESSLESLAAAAELAGWQGLLEIPVPEAVKADFQKLIAEARKTPPPKTEDRKPEFAPVAVPAEKTPPPAEKPPPTPPAKSTAFPPSEKPDPNSFEGLQAAIRADPRYAAPYYGLASLQARQGDIDSARATMRDLLRNIPGELRGHLELGRYAYEGRKLKEAEDALERFLGFAASGHPVEAGLRDEALALVILVSYLRGDDDKTRAILENAAEIFNPLRFAALPLKTPDLERLLVLRAVFGKKMGPPAD